MLLLLHRPLIGKCKIVVEMLLLLWLVTVHLGTKHNISIHLVKCSHYALLFVDCLLQFILALFIALD